jgi:hypothetical protein
MQYIYGFHMNLQTSINYVPAESVLCDGQQTYELGIPLYYITYSWKCVMVLGCNKNVLQSKLIAYSLHLRQLVKLRLNICKILHDINLFRLDNAEN